MAAQKDFPQNCHKYVMHTYTCNLQQITVSRVDAFQAMGIMALPAHAPRGWNNLSSLVDDIWHHAGDKSVDVGNYQIQ